MESKLIFRVLDRIVHPSTKGIDLEQSVAGLQRLLDGKMPSDVLAAPPHRRRPTDAWQQEINKLKQKLAEVQGEHATSERERERLSKEIAKLQARSDPTDDQARSFHTYNEVINAMVTKFGKHHGVPAALAERNARLVRDDPTLGRITTTLMQTWRRLNRYPCYVIDQIVAMSPNDLLPRGNWSETDRQFLASLYAANEQQSNCTLAAACSAQFNRLVTECSIKGELNRLRMRGKVSQYRIRAS